MTKRQISALDIVHPNTIINGTNKSSNSYGKDVKITPSTSHAPFSGHLSDIPSGFVVNNHKDAKRDLVRSY